MVSRRSVKAIDRERGGDPQAVRAAAVGLLARRDFSSAELTTRLLARGYLRDLVDSTVAELRRSRVLDDARYAEHYVGHHADRGQGPLRITAALRVLGLAEDLIEAALKAGPDWGALASEVRSGRFGRTQPRSWAEKARQGRFLQYRGFSSDHIRSAVGRDFDPDE